MRSIRFFGTAFLCAVMAMAGAERLCAQSATLTLSEAVARAARAIEARLAQGTKVAVLNFPAPAESLSNYVIDELVEVLVTNGKVTVIERKNLDLIQNEMNIQLSGNVSDDSAQSIGKQLGAQAIVSGSLTELGDMYRFRVKAINVETARIETQVSYNLGNDQQVTFLLYGDKPRPIPPSRPASLPSPAPRPAPAPAPRPAPVTQPSQPVNTPSQTPAARPANGSGIPAAALTKAGLYADDVFQDSYDLSDSLDWIKLYAVDGGKYTIALGSDQAVNNIQLDYGGKQVTVSLAASGGLRALRFGRELNNPLFTVKTGVTLTLEENVTLSGVDKKGSNLVKVLSGGKFIMNGGALKDTGSSAVSVDAGSFTMNGGTISGNRGNGVSGNGTFTMTNGTISGNSSGSYGGGVYVSGTLTMSGGAISGNAAGSFISDHGGGVYVKGTFTMSGGTINGNTAGGSSGGVAGGVYVEGTFTMSDGTISGNRGIYSGGGVWVRGTFTMSGGAISGNTTPGNYGGVCADTFTMSGGIISENTVAGDGGGVRAGTFTMTGGTISGNTASNGIGGGVNVNGTFTMKDGIISGNTAKGVGGGVYAANSFTMSGGEISKNTSSTSGGGVYGNNTVMVSGGQISGNTATGNGGGVFGNVTVTMTGGEISGNIATGNGGGVYSKSTFSMTGGVIGGNTATGNGGGVFAVYMSNGKEVAKAAVAGIIYGSNAPAGQANRAVSDDAGHAVFVEGDRRRLRNTTAGADTTLDSSKGRLEGGGWE